MKAIYVQHGAISHSLGLHRDYKGTYFVRTTEGRFTLEGLPYESPLLPDPGNPCLLLELTATEGAQEVFEDLLKQQFYDGSPLQAVYEQVYRVWMEWRLGSGLEAKIKEILGKRPNRCLGVNSLLRELNCWTQEKLPVNLWKFIGKTLEEMVAEGELVKRSRKRDGQEVPSYGLPGATSAGQQALFREKRHAER